MTYLQGFRQEGRHPQNAAFPCRRGLRSLPVSATMAAVQQGQGKGNRGDMSKRAIATCEDCYFRKEGLCALPGNSPCPTFRAATAHLTPPLQPRLILRGPLPEVAHAAGA